MAVDPIDRVLNQLAEVHLGNAPSEQNLAREALRRGWISAAQFDAALVEADRARREGREARLEQILVQHHWLSAEQLARMLEEAPAPSPSEPSRLGRYAIHGLLGRGGMGRVYRAYDPQLRRTVALKVMEAGEHLDRLRREAQAAARLNHPQIVTVFEVGEEDGKAYLAMELVEGSPLDQVWLSWPWRRRVEIIEAVARAMAYAHHHGVIHRDLKPGNVMVDADGGIKILDLGLARVEGGTRLTATGTVMGTPVYMSPEQVRGDETGIATDVYSTGVMLYEALCGTLPFVAEHSFQVYQKILTEEPPRPRAHNRMIPVELDVVCMKAIDKDPRRRYAEAGELAEELRRWRDGEPVHARPTSRFHTLRKRIHRNPWAWGFGGAAAFALCAGVLASALFKSSGDEQRAVLEHLAEAKAAYARGDLAASRAGVDAAMAIQPDHPEARYWNARLMLRDYQIRRTAPELHMVEGSIDVLPAEPETPDLQALRSAILREVEGSADRALIDGVLHIWDGELAAARDALGKVDRAAPGGWEATFYEGMVYFLSKEFERAVERIRASSGMDPPLVAPISARVFLARGMLGRIRGEDPTPWYVEAESAAARVNEAGAAASGRSLFADVNVEWGWWHMTQGGPTEQSYTNARDRFSRALEAVAGLDVPAEGNALFGLGALEDERGRSAEEYFARAVEVFDRILDARPQHVPARLQRGRVRYHPRRYKEREFKDTDVAELKAAAADYETALQVNPNSVEAAIYLAESRYLLELAVADSDEKRDAAYETLMAALEGIASGSNYYMAHGRLGAARHRWVDRLKERGDDAMGALESALEAFEQGRRINPKFYGSYSAIGAVRRQMATLYRDSKRDPIPHIEAALAAFDRSIALYQLHADVFEERGKAWFLLASWLHDRPDASMTALLNAMADYERALNIDETFFDALTGQGAVYSMLVQTRISQGVDPSPELGKAIDCYRRATYRRPSDLNAWVLKGIACAGLFDRSKNPEHRDEALKAFERGVELAPDDPLAWQNKAKLLLTIGRKPEAERALQELARCCRLATKRRPSDVEAWTLRGTALANLSALSNDAAHRDEAIEAYERVVELAPDGPFGWTHLARLLLEAKRWERAEWALAGLVRSHQTAIDREPTNVQAWADKGLACTDRFKLTNVPAHRDEALEAFSRVVDLVPKEAAAWQELAGALLEIGGHDGVERTLRLMIQRHPDLRADAERALGHPIREEF